MKRFEGKNVLITGGNSGIGLAAALAFSDEGARVTFTGRDQATLNSSKARLPENALAVKNDSSNIADGNKLAAFLKEQGIKLDAVFINAGVAKMAPLKDTEETMWDTSFNTNAKGPYFLIKALLPILNPGASIVLNGSINAHIGMPNTSVYAASKAALISLAKTLSSELITKGIRVNVVSPGPVATPLYDRLGIPQKDIAEVAAGIKAQVPLKRFGTPEEIASAVLYLASTESGYVVGTELIIDGGMSQL